MQPWHTYQGFLAEGLQRTTAGLGSIIIDSQPITVALLASLFFNERLKPLGYAGLALGVAGLLLLEVPPETLATGAPSLEGPPGALACSFMCASIHVCIHSFVHPLLLNAVVNRHSPRSLAS